MTSFHVFADQVSGLSAVAVQTCAHGAGFPGRVRFAQRDTTSVPAESLTGNPASLSASWCYPGRGLAFGVNYCESPLGFQIQDVFEGYGLSSQGIYNYDRVRFDHKFWSQPNKVSGKTKDCTKRNFVDGLTWVIANKQAVDNEQRYQKERRNRPGIVTSRSESCVHSSIIAGETK